VRIMDLVGTPWADGGRSLVRGVDCVGLALHCARVRGFEVGDPGVHLEQLVRATEIDGESLVPRGWSRIGWVELDVGDLLVTGRCCADHVAIVAEHGYALTTSRRSGATLVPLYRLRPLVRSCWRPT